ncbi:EboA domain-containing protein [Nocardiopsis xinjiangensis]|uniref:EboA domain-containing protein n=1 Tax=Nocardiopsis xinjiangensis TaxID=124285 RepID=UPI000349745F|nr:EboA domain-containing protein [Nocardiopsis xinjiangensis]
MNTEALLGGESRRELSAMVARVHESPDRVAVLFPAAARRVARGAGPSGDPDGVLGPTLEDLVRLELLRTCAEEMAPDALAREVADLYHHGDSGERRAVLRGLAVLDTAAAPVARELMADALRTNDTRLIAAAAGGPATDLLEAHAWRQAVLKCLFVGVPLAGVRGVPERVDAELVRMCADYAEERERAGRSVPDDVRLVLRHSPPDEPTEA